MTRPTMEDLYYKEKGGKLAPCGRGRRDDNHPQRLRSSGGTRVPKLSRAGRLDCDVWLIHLTGEEFPSDCMGARHLAQSIVRG